MRELMEDGSQIHHMTLYFCPNELISSQTRYPLAPGKVIKCTDQSVWLRQGCRMVAGYEHMDAMSKNHKISFPDGTGIRRMIEGDVGDELNRRLRGKNIQVVVIQP